MEDAYNALKTYLMLADKTHAESSHLNDQLTRFWRGWLEAQPRRHAARADDTQRRAAADVLPGADRRPVLAAASTQKLALVDQARENLRRVVRGMPARERVYADVKARAATRFPAMTVARIVGEQDQALVAGSYAVSGAFTRAGLGKVRRRARFAKPPTANCKAPTGC